MEQSSPASVTTIGRFQQQDGSCSYPGFHNQSRIISNNGSKRVKKDCLFYYSDSSTDSDDFHGIIHMSGGPGCRVYNVEEVANQHVDHAERIRALYYEKKASAASKKVAKSSLVVSLPEKNKETPKPSAHQRKHLGPKTTKSCKKNGSKKKHQSKAWKKKNCKASPAPSAEQLEWEAPQNIAVEETFWGIRKAKIVLPGDTKDENCLINHILKDQRLSLEYPLEIDGQDKAVQMELKGPCGNYKMVSAKIFSEKSTIPGSSVHNEKKYARVAYATTGNMFSFQDHLLRMADFMTLNPRKIAARMELLQSPTKLKITYHEDSLFQEIKDLGYVGGGFIHEDTLAELLQKAGMGCAAARRAVAIQVRIFVPSMGIFKGMLVKKRTKNGPPVELPWSMKKVMASTHTDRFEGGHIVINKYKVYPMKGHQMLGRLFDHSKKPPTKKQLKDNMGKPLSEMVRRLWETLGVSRDLFDRYKNESLQPDRKNHAWLVGVPDPTGSLPPDTIFVPGIKTQKGHYDIFVTRSPCMAREHGRKFGAIIEKPEEMEPADWDWLNNNLSFGVIVFSNPRPGKMSIPERIASGDLDGDLYLVCWDKEVVDSMTRVEPLVDKPAEDDGKLATVPSDPEWFSKSLEIQIEKLGSGYNQLVGSLYRFAETIADKPGNNLDHPDARALFSAYNEALEYAKHGRPICLPRHLIKELKPHLQPLVEPIDHWQVED